MGTGMGLRWKSIEAIVRLSGLFMLSYDYPLQGKRLEVIFWKNHM
jgi:hypothetical protein